MAADRYNCYAGELVTLFFHFIVPQNADATLQISLPNVMQVESYQMPEGISASSLALMEVDQKSLLDIPLNRNFEKGAEYEISIQVRVKTFQIDQYLLCEVRIFDAEFKLLAYEAAQITVISKGRYLQHLPEIYEKDEFINRFLMLIESFWKPINQQIEQVDCYFDPLLTPPQMLPWLSSWIGLSFDDLIPVHRMRSLLKTAIIFYQQRGTLPALKTYLEMFSGGKVSIVEKRASDFVLGSQGKLGVERALGSENQPNSILIDIQIPAEELNQVKLSAEMYKNKIMESIRALVPAHTAFKVNCEFVDNNNVLITKGI
jgi:phage tail-like protein